ncbi:MAG: hypothetical protein A4E42_02393 [Methanoregulaceae archaeon PtaU1.Bin222]|nr:MAG: hypothetical protein A4E42_02393 [Methanoregulaceae archaeon PtaU1.Bin222]
MKSERRTQYEIYWEILVFCKTPRSFTSITHRCNLNSKTGQDYIGFLLSRRYLSEVDEEGTTVYRSTDNASEYLALFNQLYRALFDSVPGFSL